MRVLMIAPPGAGKGTQGVLIAERFHVPHIATGDLLRDHVARGTDIGRSVQSCLDRGDLVPDDVVLEMVREALTQVKGRGYVLDGVPRTMAQAKALYGIAVDLDLTADVALHLAVPDDELVRRLVARAADQGRTDDTEEVIARRLEVYDEVTRPILAWYEQRGILVDVDGSRPPEQVTSDVMDALDEVHAGLERPGLRPPLDRTGLGAAFGAD